MKKHLILLLSVSGILSLTGCTLIPVSPSNNSNGNSNSGTTSNNPTSQGDEGTPALANSEEYLNFWNPNTKIELNITMSLESAKFIDNYQSDHDECIYHDYYVPCTVNLKVNNQSYDFEEVGIRQKGNMSRTRMLSNDNFTLDKLAHYKLSFKETFDDEEYDTLDILKPFKKDWSNDSSGRKARKNRTLFDMEKIDIKWNRNDDETRSKQAYTLKTFRDNGVIAGQVTLGKISLGVANKAPITTTYEILEVIDSVFIKRYYSLENADGDLYKCSYTNKGPANFSSSYQVGNQIGVEDNTKYYHPAYDLKTNKKKNTTHQTLLDLIKAINKDSLSAEEYKSNIEQYLDMESFMKYESIAYLAGNFDDLRNNANNYYLYIPNLSKKAIIIPYDFDRCFGAGAEGRKDYMTDFSPESTKMQCNGQWQTISLYWRSVCQNTSQKNIERVEAYRALYQKNIEDLINNKIISKESFTSYVNSFPTDYRGNPNGDGKDNTTFENYLNKKIAAIKKNTNYDIK